jgi:hypothetical protein
MRQNKLVEITIWNPSKLYCSSFAALMTAARGAQCMAATEEVLKEVHNEYLSKKIGECNTGHKGNSVLMTNTSHLGGSQGEDDNSKENNGA